MNIQTRTPRYSAWNAARGKGSSTAHHSSISAVLSSRVSVEVSAVKNSTFCHRLTRGAPCQTKRVAVNFSASAWKLLKLHHGSDKQPVPRTQRGPGV